MDQGQPYMPLVLVVVGLLALGVVVRIARSAYLRRVTLTDEQTRDLQVRITDAARRASIQPGMEINLLPFWAKSGIKEPDRRAVIHPLVETNIFGWYERQSADGFENFLDAVGRVLWMPTRSRVVVSQWVKDDSARGESATVIIEKVLGGIDMSQTDNSINFGPRAGRDVIGGDRVGHDKAGRDAHGVSAGGDMYHSGNVDSAFDGNFSVSTTDELGDALTALAGEAQRRGEPPAVVDALRWAAQCATGGQQPNPLDQAKHQRTLDRASEWLQAALRSIAEGATGALVGHWMLNILHG